MSKKRIAKIAALAVLIIALGGAAIYGIVKADRCKRDMQYGYTRSLNDLRDCVGNIEITLNKAGYANTATQQNGLAAKLMRESSMAKSSLAVLPLTDNSMDNVSKFITQVGDFSMTLSKRISERKNITGDEYETMANLEKFSQKLQKDLESVKPDFSGSKFNDSLKETAKDFTDFPSLIYDGPFSDGIGRKKPKLTEGKKQLAQGNAQNTAAEFLNFSQDKLTHTQDTEGSLPTYNFTANNGDIRICVTKTGGYISDMANTRDVGVQKFDYKAASKKARDFLNSRGIQNMKESYYVINDGVCLINYALMQDEVICYPDLVKVGVALDNGEIVRFQSTGYIMNHTTRKFTAKLTKQQAKKSVSPSLTVQQGRLALIPTPGLNEVLCYEFLCSGKDRDRVLVYINASSGYEEDILILQISDSGVLTK